MQLLYTISISFSLFFLYSSMTGELLHETVLPVLPDFEEGIAESYILAWYSIANLFIELTPEEIARPSIAC